MVTTRRQLRWVSRSGEGEQHHRSHRTMWMPPPKAVSHIVVFERILLLVARAQYNLSRLKVRRMRVDAELFKNISMNMSFNESLTELTRTSSEGRKNSDGQMDAREGLKLLP